MKKALALILTLIMVLGLMPAAMAANDDPIQSVTQTDNDLVINKSVKQNTDGSYALTIEAYATGTSSTTTQSVPLDIVLVLDVSGSMKDAFGGEYVAQEKEYKKSDFGFLSDTLYYKYTDNNYYPVYYDWDYNWTDGIKYVLYFYDSSNTVHYLTSDGNLADSPTYLSEDKTLYTGVLYKLTRPSKMNVLKSAVNNFIDTVAADASTNSVNHQIAIVKFAGTMKHEVGNDKYKEGQYSYNYSQTVVDLTDVSVSGNENTLKQKVSELTHGGATAADYGMQLANGLLSESQEGRKQIVVMFTDGEPNHGNGFDEDVANAAISAAKAMKDRKVTVYTIGAIQDPSNDVKEFLEYTSSNYPDAQSMRNAGDKATEKYYKLVNTENALAGIFETIASETTQTSAAANASSVLEDKLTGYFDFANLSGSNITGYTVQTAACTGADTWDTPVDASGVSVSVKDNDTIDITDFDYTSDGNLVVNKDGKWQGNKLIVTFNIVLDESAEGWKAGLNRVPTNANGFACIKGKDDQPLIALTESPEVDVYAYEVKYEVNGPAPTAHSDIPQAKVYLAGKTGKTVPVAGDLTTAETSNNGQAGVWNFNGWKKGEEGIQTIQIPNGPAEDEKYTITITGTWTFKPTEQFGSLTITKEFGGNSALNANNWPDGKQLTFTIVNDDGKTVKTVTLPKNGQWIDTVQLAPGTYTVTESDAGMQGYAVTTTSDPADGKVTVSATANGNITFTNTYTENTVEANGSLTIKKEFGSDSAITADNWAGLTNNKQLTFTITKAGATAGTTVTLPTNDTTNPWTYTVNNLSVGEYTVTETGAEDGYGLTVTNKTDITTAADGNTGTVKVTDDSASTITFTNTYTKMEDNTGSLIVKKTVSGNEGDKNKYFTFTVTLKMPEITVDALAAPIINATPDTSAAPTPVTETYGDVTFTNGVATFTLKHNESKTIKDIPAGYTYTVTESDNAGYTVTSENDKGTIEGGKTANVKFTNTKGSTPTPTPTPYNGGGGYYYPTTTPVPVIVIPPKTGDMTIWQSILHFLGIR